MDSKELFQQARNAHSTSDFEKAVQLYERVTWEYPSSEEAELSRAHIYNIRQGTESGIQTSDATSATVNPRKRGDGVVITDIQMPFWSMVVLMVKAAIAAIPAIIILFVIFSVLLALFGGTLGILGGLRR